MKINTMFNVMILLVIGILSHGCMTEKANSQSKGISTPFSKGTTSQKKQALIVGVSDYAGERDDLGGIERDVAKMKALFSSWGFDVKVLYDGDSMNIVDELNGYANSLDSDDFFAFYYSGHGSHIKDESGDESDGEDETLVLSDGDTNKHLIDDILYQKFNAIKAKKLIFFDSCHSGTVFRSLNGKVQSKSIKPEDVSQSFMMSSSKGIQVSDSISSSNGDFIVFSSSQDNEESLATPTGSLFTNSVSEVFSDSSLSDKSLKSINSILVTKVIDYAKETDGAPHHPNISFSDPKIGTKSLRDFVSSKSTPPPTTIEPQTVNKPTVTDDSLQSTLNGLIASGKIKPLSLKYDKSVYTTGDLVTFKIDTLGEKGFLSIFYVDSNDVTVLYPNPYVSTKKLGGSYMFPNDLSNGKFDVEAYKACSGCEQEKTTVYVLLSPEPISDIKSINSSELLSFKKDSYKSKVLTRAVKLKATSKKNGMQPMLSRYEFKVN